MGGQLSWLERTPDKREVDGSSPFRPILLWGFSSAGRAPALHAGGQRFDPVKLHCRQLDADKTCSLKTR